jgi:hypothetical protein
VQELVRRDQGKFMNPLRNFGRRELNAYEQDQNQRQELHRSSSSVLTVSDDAKLLHVADGNETSDGSSENARKTTSVGSSHQSAVPLDDVTSSPTSGQRPISKIHGRIRRSPNDFLEGRRQRTYDNSLLSHRNSHSSAGLGRAAAAAAMAVRYKLLADLVDNLDDESDVDEMTTPVRRAMVAHGSWRHVMPSSSAFEFRSPAGSYDRRSKSTDGATLRDENVDESADNNNDDEHDSSIVDIGKLKPYSSRAQERPSPQRRRRKGLTVRIDNEEMWRPIDEYEGDHDRAALQKTSEELAPEALDDAMTSLEVVVRSSKRGFNDIADLCVAHNCSGKSPGSLDYIRCLRQFRCT